MTKSPSSATPAATKKVAAGAAKKPRNRRSSEQKLAELKRRLLEIGDLGAAGAVLGWDQATYMPKGGSGARSRTMRASFA